MPLRISYFVPPVPLVAAKASGLLDDLTIEETRTPGSAAQLAGLLAGELDVVVTALDNLFEWTRAGADLRVIGEVEHTTPLAVYAAPEFSDLQALEGATFAVDALDNGFALVARHLLHEAGVSVQWVEAGGVAERFEQLRNGDAAAALLGPPFDARARDAGFRELIRVQDVFPSFPGQGLVVRADLAGSAEVSTLVAALNASGLLPVQTGGLDLLAEIRADLGLLPPQSDLHALVLI